MSHFQHEDEHDCTNCTSFDFWSCLLFGSDSFFAVLILCNPYFTILLSISFVNILLTKPKNILFKALKIVYTWHLPGYPCKKCKKLVELVLVLIPIWGVGTPFFWFMRISNWYLVPKLGGGVNTKFYSQNQVGHQWVGILNWYPPWLILINRLYILLDLFSL